MIRMGLASTHQSPNAKATTKPIQSAPLLSRTISGVENSSGLVRRRRAISPWVMMFMSVPRLHVLPDQPVADRFAGDVDDGCGGDQQKHDGRNVGIFELPNGHIELLPDATGADNAQGRGGAHIDLEAQQQIA